MAMRASCSQAAIFLQLACQVRVNAIKVQACVVGHIVRGRARTNLLPCCRNKEEAMSTIDRNLTPRWSRLKTRFAAWRRLTRTRRCSRTEAEIQAYTRPWI
jgi:hypothetical protein